MYKLIAIDIDGTLLNDEKMITEENKNAIKAAQKKGIKIVLTSGRPPQGIREYAKELEIFAHDDYFISYNGALAEEINTSKIISRFDLYGKDYKEIHDIAIDLGFEPYAFDTDYCIATQKYKCVMEEIVINNIPFEKVDISSFSEHRPLLKVMLSSPNANFMDKAIPKLPSYLFEKYTTLRSTPFLFEFIHKGANKGSGVALLAKKLNIEQSAIICIGDSGNDIHMIQYAGLGVAMGNGTKEAKEVSKFITKSNNESGVAFCIEKYIL